MKKVLNISGGATKITGLLSASKAISQKMDYRPDIITGVSSGAICAMIVATGLYSKAEEVLKDLSLSTFMDQPPVNSKGKLTLNAYIRALTGKNSLGVQNIPKVLSQIITKEVFDRYQMQSRIMPDVWIIAINARTGAPRSWNAKWLTYEKYLQVVAASCAIPVFTQPIEIEGEIYYDGGLRNHIGGAWLLKHIKPQVGEMISIFSRPKIEDFKLEREKPANGLFQLLNDTITIMNIDISSNDEYAERAICKARGIKYLPLHMPSITKSVYDVDKDRLKKLSLEAERIAIKEYQLWN